MRTRRSWVASIFSCEHPQHRPQSLQLSVYSTPRSHQKHGPGNTANISRGSPGSAPWAALSGPPRVRGSGQGDTASIHYGSPGTGLVEKITPRALRP